MTFHNRNTDIDARSQIYAESFKNDAQKQTQWTAFLKKNKLESENNFARVVGKIKLLIEPLFDQNEFNKWNPEKWSWE